MKRGGPLKRKTPLRSRHEPNVQREDRPRAIVMPTVKPLHRGVIQRVTGAAQPQPKDDPVRSEPYRRLVAARPCKNCGKSGHSQAAHLPPEGKQIKQDDRLTFPLCADEPGALGCHSKFDRYILFPREEAMEQGMQWARETQAEIAAEGKWPKRLPRWAQ